MSIHNRTNYLRSTQLYLCLLCILVISACAITTKTQTPNFYVLDATAVTMAEAKPVQKSVGIGPVELAGYVNRPQIVTRLNSSELQLAEFHRWAEPLDDMFSRVLIENVKILFANDQIFQFPRQHALPAPEYRITARVLKFETNLDGVATLAVQWNVIKDRNADLSKSIHSEYRAFANDRSYPARIAALNDTIAQFAASIKKEIQ